MPARKKQSEKVDKRYRTKMVIPGQDKPVWITAKTKKELEDKKRALRQHLIDGTTPTDRPFVEVIIEWFNVIKRPKIKTASTLKSWQNAINLHVLPYLDARQLCRAVRYRDLREVVSASEGLNITTIALVHATLVHACRYACREGYMLRDPSADLERATPKQPRQKDALTQEQTRKLLDGAKLDDFGPYIYTLYYTGMRRGEALGLQWGDFDWEHKLVHVQRDVDFNAGSSNQSIIGPVKTPQSVRWVPLPDELVGILYPLRGLPNVFVFTVNGHTLTPNEFTYRWGRCLVRCGLGTIKQSYYDLTERRRAEGKRLQAPNPRYDYDIEITPHYLRHNYITACVVAGIPAEVTMRIVGHADYSTTINIYTHIKAKQLRGAAVDLSRVLGGVDKKLTSADGQN